MSAISWRSVLLVEEIGETTDLPQVIDKFYHTMLYRLSKVRTYNFSVLIVVNLNTIRSRPRRPITLYG
jgi:hypothetical protein